MLNELKNLEYQGGREGLLFFICNTIGRGLISKRDAEIICTHTAGKRYWPIDDLITYCCSFGWIHVSEENLSVSSDIIADLSDKDKLNNTLIVSTISQLFEAGVIDSNMFFYDAVECSYAFKNELLPLSLSCVRNVLISQGFFIPKRNPQGTRFYIAPAYDALISTHCKKHRKALTLEQLKKRLESNEVAGEKAEMFVLDFERKRLGFPLCEKIKRISEIDVAAGYDIISFDSKHSQVFDRFIEVKATANGQFYWSKNEYEIAKLKGNEYYLYLVDLSKVNRQDYAPEIIMNPADSIMNSEEWLIETQTYCIRHI